jgi:hypothetical protein
VVADLVVLGAVLLAQVDQGLLLFHTQVMRHLLAVSFIVLVVKRLINSSHLEHLLQFLVELW